jgi:hypothetical protein
MTSTDKQKEKESEAAYFKDGPSINNLEYYNRKALEAFSKKEEEQ